MAEVGWNCPNSMRWLCIRSGAPPDLDAVVELIEDFVEGHPARSHPRSRDRLHAALFGDHPVANLLVAEVGGRVVGMVQWTRLYDLFWSAYGGTIEWLHVRRDVRGLGIAAALVAEACARVRQVEGEFLHGHGGDDVARLYERVAVGATTRSFYLSAEAFQAFADLAGSSPRELVRRLPSRGLNRVPAYARP